MKKLINKDRIVILIFILLIGIYGFYINFKDDKVKSQKPEKNQTLQSTIDSTTNKYLYIHVDGEVVNPGMYKLKHGERINDAIMQAGGLTDKAITNNINFAQKLEDEMKIHIPSNESINDNNENSSIKKGKININTATSAELMTLPGIGEVKADSIIKYRENTKFVKIEDIMNVNGIGDSTFDSLKEEISIN